MLLGDIMFCPHHRGVVRLFLVLVPGVGGLDGLELCASVRDVSLADVEASQTCNEDRIVW